MAADGCWDAWPDHPESLYATQPMGDQMGPRGKVTTFVNAQGLRLAAYYWPAVKPKAVIQLLHGNGAYVMEFLRTQVWLPACLSIHISTLSLLAQICAPGPGFEGFATRAGAGQRRHRMKHCWLPADCRVLASRSYTRAHGWSASTMRASRSPALTSREPAFQKACAACAASLKASMT